MRVEIIPGLEQITPDAWNALVQDNNPFLRHEFLIALERHGCVGASFGWIPRHITVYNEDDDLIGAMPLYEKYNSYGEFVFDHAWAGAYEQHNLEYYPKLVSAIPYTPASGQRLLCKSELEGEIFPVLIKTVMHLAEKLEVSSFHCLFPLQDQQKFMNDCGLLARHDCQFHWHNHQYKTFDDFLAQLSSKKRKNIRQERRKVAQANIELKVLNGHSATEEDWERFAFFYTHTFESKWGTPTLNQGFFSEVASHLPDQVVLVMAYQNEECIAGSLMFASDTRLFGRHWGCTEHIDCLHFEACYYQGIEYCIAHGLQVFEPGAQGEHKVPRGFVPVRTESSHWLASDVFRGPIERYTAQEREAVAEYIASMWKHVPYRKEVIDPLFTPTPTNEIEANTSE